MIVLVLLIGIISVPSFCFILLALSESFIPNLQGTSMFNLVNK